jgi:hypothetical protein
MVVSIRSIALISGASMSRIPLGSRASGRLSGFLLLIAYPLRHDFRGVLWRLPQSPGDRIEAYLLM